MQMILDGHNSRRNVVALGELLDSVFSRKHAHNMAEMVSKFTFSNKYTDKTQWDGSQFVFIF